jgi:signal peptidase I
VPEGSGSAEPAERTTAPNPSATVPPAPASGSSEFPRPAGSTPPKPEPPTHDEPPTHGEPRPHASTQSPPLPGDEFAFAPSAGERERSDTGSTTILGAQPEHGARTAPSRFRREGREPKRRSFWRELPLLVLLSLALALILKTLVVQAFFIPSPSMEPTLIEGDRVLVNKLATRFGDVHRGDVIVFEDPEPGIEQDSNPVSGFFRWLSEGLGVARPAEEDFIKRVIALPGETWEIHDGTLLIDGSRIQEPYLDADFDDRSFGPDRVPEGMLFVLGDNRLQSYDSRFAEGLGYIPRDKVVGKAFAVVWPPGRIGGV